MAWWRRKKSGQSPMEIQSESSDPSNAVPLPPEIPDPNRERFERLEEISTDLIRRLDDLSSSLERLRFELDDRLPQPIETFQFEEGSDAPDDEYAQYLHYFVLDENVSKINGELLEVQIIGQLLDGSFAWVNEERRVCGVVTQSQLGDVSPFPDDRFRARIVSYPWGHIVETVVPGSLRGPLQSIRRPVSKMDWGRAAIEPVLAGRATWLQQLRPGDVVLAHISYEGPLPVDRRGRLAKVRPAVFMRWEGDYAVVRACYGIKSFVGERDLGYRSVDSNCFTKSTVIRFAEFDVRIDHLNRKIGRLGPKDLQALHLDEIQPTPAIGEPVAVTEPPRVAPSRSSVEFDAESLNREILNRTLDLVVAVASQRVKNVDQYQMAKIFLHVLVERDDSRELLLTNGIKFAVAGERLQQIAKSKGTRIPPGTFGLTMRDVVGNFVPTGPWTPYIDSDEHGHEVLRVERLSGISKHAAQENQSQPVPIDRTKNWGNDEYSRFALPDEYLVPELIIMDQPSSAFILGDSRVNLSAELVALRFGGTARGIIVGSDEEPTRASFILAAESRGWEFQKAEHSRRLETIVDIVRATGAEVVTLICRETEFLVELENNGVDVNLVCELEESE